jgi:hypothetical protein
MRKGLLEELKALRDLRSGVDVERRAEFSSERSEVDSVALQHTVAISEGAGIGRGGDLFLQT